VADGPGVEVEVIASGLGFVVGGYVVFVEVEAIVALGLGVLSITVGVDWRKSWWKIPHNTPSDRINIMSKKRRMDIL